jgi:hypothetical protein
MSEQIQKLGFSYIDDTSEDLKSKAGGHFGLNTPAFLTKFELNPNAGADGTAADALDITIQVVDKEYRQRVYPVEKVYDSNSNEITDQTSVEYIKAYNLAWAQKNAVIIHVLKCFRTDEEVRQALAQPSASFADYVGLAVGLLPGNFESKPLDTFLEYQWSIGDGQDRTFLQLPRNMKGGYWLCPSVPHVGEWNKSVGTDGTLKYVDTNNLEHPFFRDKNFTSSKKGSQQIEGEESANEALQGAAGAAQGGW